MSVKYNKSGFTLVELLTVLAIIAVLMGVLVPSLVMVRNAARRAKQAAQFGSIDQALMAFRSDYGDYPRSGQRDRLGLYNGAQKLAEALLGLDLMGFHPDSHWQSDGRNAEQYLGVAAGVYWFYDPDNPIDMEKRVGPYLELASTSAFTLRQLFGDSSLPIASNFNLDNFVICDSFGRRNVPVGETIVRAGTPILYYRANTSSKTMTSLNTFDRTYDSEDNQTLIVLKSIEDNIVIDDPLRNRPLFYDPAYKVIDQKIFQATGRLWPHRADSYILISAGPDGLYGTHDDITNF